MRPSLLLLALLAVAPALAQTVQPAQTSQTVPPPIAPPQAGARVSAEADTVAALHRLFAARRNLRAGVSIGLVGTGTVGFALAAGARNLNAEVVLGLGALLISIPALAGELVYLHRFSRQNEAEAVAAQRAHRLPNRWRRKLKPQFFRP